MNKIDLIIDALYKTKLLMDAHGQYPHTLREVNEALAAARELKALKPVAWLATEKFAKTMCSITTVTLHQQMNGTPLYALDEVKHD